MTDTAPPTSTGSPWLRARRRAADILFSRDKDEPWTRRADLALIALIALNVVAVILESVHEIRLIWGTYFHVFDILSVAIFSVEYGLRVWSAVDDPWQDRYRHPFWGRLRFARTTMALIDLLAILPFYLGFFVRIDLRFLRVLRLLRIFKLTRYSGSMTLLFQVLRQEGSTIGASMFVLLLLLVMASSLAFIFEGHSGVGPTAESFASIPAAMYWAVITMTTVGYGDVVPATAVGKVLTAVIAVISVGMVALPAGILASGFTSAVQRRREQVEDKVEDALADGRMSAEDEAEIADLVERLNISDAEVRSIVAAVHRDRAEENMPCPHCGRRPHEPGNV